MLCCVVLSDPLAVQKQLVISLSGGAISSPAAGADQWPALVAAVLEHGVDSGEARALLDTLKQQTQRLAAQLGEWAPACSAS